MVKRILVGVDFSPASGKAVEMARDWAARLGGLPVTAMHVLHEPALRFDKAWEEKTEAHAREKLEAWVKDCPGFSTKVVWGDPAGALVEAADLETLILVGNVGHSMLEHMLFGSTASKVVRHAPCDVLVIRKPRS
nr:universal stress protein [uncultured Holophaga sp.]